MNAYGITHILTRGIYFSILFLMYRCKVNFLFHYELVLISRVMWDIVLKQEACHLKARIAAIVIYSYFNSLLMFLTLQASQGNIVIDYKDWQIPLGRRFRWFLGSFPLETFSLFLSLPLSLSLSLSIYIYIYIYIYLYLVLKYLSFS